LNDNYPLADEMRRASTHAIFHVMDYMKFYLKEATSSSTEQREHLNAMLDSIPDFLCYKAACSCQAYPRALRHLERQLEVGRNNQSVADRDALLYQMQKTYTKMNEPDQVAGISKMISSASLKSTVLGHESTGDWVSALSCYEVMIADGDDALEYNLGVFKCHQNLRHYGVYKHY